MLPHISNLLTFKVNKFIRCSPVAQNKGGILPVAILSIALYVLRRSYVSQRCRARGGNFVIGFININKYTSASENVHLCLLKCTPLPLNRQLGHISVATGRIPSFCGCSILQFI